MNTTSQIIQIELEEAIAIAWKNFQNGNPLLLHQSRSAREAFRLCFVAGFLDGVKVQNVSDQLERRR